MRAQIFTIDLVLGTIIILSILGGAYGISAYYSSLNQSAISSGDLSGEFSSAVTALMLVNTTRTQVFNLQNGSPSSTFSSYIQQTLGKEIPFPYSVTIYFLEDYANLKVPNVPIFSFSSSGFSNMSSSQTFYEPLLVTNSSPLCSSLCNSSLGPISTFPTQNVTVNAPKCLLYTNSQHSTGWQVFNNTPAGQCTIAVGSYFVKGPNNYLIKAYSSAGVSEGQLTLYVFGLALVVVKIQ
jgi:hypothetical protein